LAHARIFNRTDGKFELETRFAHRKLRNELAFKLPADTRVFDRRIGDHGRWVLSDAVRPRVLDFLRQLDFDVEEVLGPETEASSSEPPIEATPGERLEEITPDMPELPAP